jgi:hypothetical protein
MRKLLHTAVVLGSLVVLSGCAVHGTGYTYVEPSPVYVSPPVVRYQYYRPYYYHRHYTPHYYRPRYYYR